MNTQLTAPPALCALAMIYLKSENELLARNFSAPETLYEVKNTNPNHTILKIVAKNLILWNKIKPAKAYIEDQIPPLIRLIVTGSMADLREMFPKASDLEEIDFSGVSLIYYHTIAGAIIALGLKYAGTGSEEAKDIILYYINKLLKVETSLSHFVSGDPQTKGKLDPYYLYNILSNCVLASSLVMAGTADIDCLKKARIVRKHLQFKLTNTYGFNMAIHMAIGFLSLGKGGYTFGRDNIHIAVLLVSIFPHWPKDPNDNKYHL